MLSAQEIALPVVCPQENEISCVLNRSSRFSFSADPPHGMRGKLRLKVYSGLQNTVTDLVERLDLKTLSAR